MKKWSVLIILAVAQFIMVLDSTVMNVSISEVVKSLGTTVSGLQAAITLYTLTMAALMLTGGKLGDKWGRLRTFKIGAVVYAIGSLITAFSPGLPSLLIGWSIIEGLGAVLVIPAIAAIAASSYSGKDRAMAFAAIGAVGGAAAAAGPLIGGFVTTYFSWRYVFAAETVIMIILLIVTRSMKATKPTKSDPLDMPSVFLSVAGMGMLVFGMLQSKSWGWILPRGAMSINGHEITPLGISMVAYLLLFGGVLLWVFFSRQQKLEANGGYPLLRVSLFKIPVLRSGLAVLMAQYMIIASVFFIIPIFLQVVLGLNALDTGIRILPLSAAVIVFSVVGTRLTKRLSLRSIVRIGQAFLVLGAILILGTISTTLDSVQFGISMFVIGAGIGMLASQLGNINMSSVDASASSEVGGVQGTFQNLGSSLGTALIGSVFIATLTSGFVTSLQANPSIPPSVTSQVATATKAGAPVVPASQVKTAALNAGLSESESEAISSDYLNSQLDGLKQGVFFIAILAIITIPFSRNIPATKSR